MNNLNKKEQEFKSVLDDIQFDLDTHAIWNSIEGDLPKKQRRLGFYWIFALGLVLTTVSITYYLTLGLKVNSEISLNNLAVLNADDFTNSPIKDKENWIVTDEILLKNNDHSNTEIIHSKNIIKKPNQSIVFHPKSVNYNSSTNKSQKITKSALNPTFNESKVAINQKIEILTLPFIDKISLLTKNNSIQYPKIDLIKMTDWKPFVHIYSGIHQSMSNYEMNNDVSKSIFDHEKGKIGMSIGFNFGKTHISGWEWYLGVKYQQIVAGFQDDYSEIKSSKIEGITSIYIDENGDESARYGDVNQTTIIEKKRNLYRKHKMLDLNLGLAKRILKKKRFSIKLGTGIGITAISKHKGYYFNEFGENIQIKDDNHPYKINGMIKHFSNATMDYSIAENYQFGVKVDYAYDLNSLTENSNFYKLKNSQYGIYFTISYRPY